MDMSFSRAVTADPSELAGITGQVLIVDDDRLARFTHRAMLARRFDVSTASSGEEALEICRTQPPDLILLDIEMPGINGIETCRLLRELASVPVIFVTSNDSLDLHIDAYEAGGNDIVAKPVRFDVLLRKATLAIRQHREQIQLAHDKQALQHIAMSFLATASDSGTLLNFMRDSVGCRSYRHLVRKLLDCVSSLGVQGMVCLRHGGETTTMTPQGEATSLELSILDMAVDMGRIFQFKQRLVVNYPHVSIMIADMPDEAAEADRAGKIRDNVTILAETAEGLCDIVTMRIESMRRAEQMQLALSGGVAAVEELRRKYLLMLADTRLLLQDMLDKMNKSFAWLGATQDEEARISTELDASVQAILTLLSEGSDFEMEFGKVLDALRGNRSVEVELF